MWKFREYQEGEVMRDLHEEEFFTMQLDLESLVREAIQNSIDASLNGEEKVTVRFLYDRASIEAGYLISELKDHLYGSGIKASGVGDSSFEFLAVEDFNTTGLTGTTSYDECLKKGEGNFCNFWWVDGSTKKGMKKGGRWGLGKYSFFTFSKLKLFFGISLAEGSGEPMLMGRILLKRHTVNQKAYSPDGVFAEERFDPVTDSAELKKFQSLFELERGTRSGLSVVIPYPKIDDIPSFESDIIRIVLNNYMYAVVVGKLEVNIEWRDNNSNKKKSSIDKDSVKSILQKFSQTDKRFKELEKTLELYNNIISSNNPEFILKTIDKNMLKIDESHFMDKLEEARKIYSSNSNSIIKIRVPFIIPSQDSNLEETTYVDISISKNYDFKRQKVICIRNGIKVPNGINFEIESGIIVMVADDSKASEFLGDSENPSHTEWNPSTEKLRSGKYLSAEATLRFIKSLPQELVNILSKVREYEDNEILSDIFPIKNEIQKPGKKTRTPTPPIPPKPSSRTFDLLKESGGFTLKLAKEGQATLPLEITIKTAYDTVDGNPFKNYNVFDYEIGKGKVKIEKSEGYTHLELNKNEIRVRADDKNFILAVYGFDQRRDLILSIKSKEVKEE